MITRPIRKTKFLSEADEVLLKISEELQKGNYIHIYKNKQAEVALCGHIKRNGGCKNVNCPTKITDFSGCNVCGRKTCPFCRFLVENANEDLTTST